MGMIGGAVRALKLGASVIVLALASHAALAQDVGPVSGQATILDPIVITGGYEDARGSFEGYLAGKTATATKTATSIIDVPQSISVIGREEMDSRSATRLSETLRYTPGVTVEADGVDSRFDSISIRGFNTDNATWLDGMPYQAGASLGSGNNWTIPQIDTWMLERVEVLKGPSSSMYGQLPPGGMINQVTKRPSDEASRHVEGHIDSFGKPTAAFDITGPLNDAVSYRLLGKFGKTGSEVEEGERTRLLIAPSFSVDVGDGKFTAYAQLQRDRGGIDYSWLPAYGTLYDNPHGRISRSFFAGEPDFNRYDRNQYIVGYDYETPVFTDNLTLRHALRWSKVQSTLNMVQNDMFGASMAGWDWRTIDRYAVDASGDANNLVSDTSLNWQVETGQVRHQIVAGVDIARSTFDASRYSGTAPSIDMFDPVYGTGPVGDFELSSNIDARLSQIGLYVQDQMEIGNFRVLGALRQDFTDGKSNVETWRDMESIDQKDKATSGRLGLLYRFDNGFAPYASYGTSFQPVLGATADGDVFKPMTGEQYEVGIRYAPSDDLLWSASVFDIRQTNRLTDDPVYGWPDQVQTGEVRIRGFETELKADLQNGWSVTAAYSYLDHKVTKSEIPEELGQPVIFVPNHQASLWVDYTVPAGMFEAWRLGAGLRYTGSSRGGDIETLSGYAGMKIPDYALVDFRLSAPLDQWIPGGQLNLSVNNVFDKKYVAGCGSVWTCGFDYGRTGTLSVSAKF